MKITIQTKKGSLFPPSSIQTFPEEVLVKIFSYLSLGELTSTVPKVCKQWERLHWDRALYNMPRIGLLESEGTATKVLNSLQDARCLRSAYFENDFIREAINTCISKISTISNKVKSSKTDINQNINECFKDVLIILSHLEVIHLKYMSFSEAHTEALAHLVGNCCGQLKELYTSDNSFTHMNADLCGQLQDTLRVLHVYSTDWNLGSIHAITKCRHLEDLDIQRVGALASEGLLDIAKMSSLRSLYIQACMLESKETWTSALTNHALKELTSLKLHDCNLDDNVAVAIGANQKNLIELELVSRCSWPPASFVSSYGLESIIKGCSKLTNFEVQTLNDSDDEIGNVLLMIPEYLPGLKALAVFPVHSVCSRSSYRPKWKVALGRKMPHVHILVNDTK